MTTEARDTGLRAFLRRRLGRIWLRLLAVNLIVLLVPIAGMEFARVYERTLLDALERDMRNQAILVARLVEENTRELDRYHALPRLHERHSDEFTPDDVLGPSAPPEAHFDISSIETILERAARRTRMRIRVVDEEGSVLADSHVDGPPEGEEPTPPSLFGSSSASRRSWDMRSPAIELWPAVADRSEIRDALAGNPSSKTRVRDQEPAVFLFVTEPVRRHGVPRGAVYVVRSTTPVLFELYRIRSGLYSILGIATALSLFITLLLALSISRPLNRLARASGQIAKGHRKDAPSVEGSGEIYELSQSVATMTNQLNRRMQYISDFAADVAHEFKSPLTSIRGAAELLGEGAADDPTARARFLNNIALDTERLDRLVSRLLELSRIETAYEARRETDLYAFVQHVVETTRPHPGVPVEIRYEARARTVAIRAQSLETALRNLLDNAFRFSEEASESLSLAGERPDTQPPVEVRIGQDARNVTIAVRDRGPGIPEANLARIFDRFFTTDAERNGTGLGLAIVKTVAEQHGGHAWAENHPEGGAVLSIQIPVR